MEELFKVALKGLTWKGPSDWSATKQDENSWVGGGGFQKQSGARRRKRPSPLCPAHVIFPPFLPLPSPLPLEFPKRSCFGSRFFKNLKLIIPRKEGAFPRSGSRPSARFIAELQKDLLEDSDWSIPGDRTTTNALLTVNTAGPDLIIGRGDRKPNRPRLLRGGRSARSA